MKTLQITLVALTMLAATPAVQADVEEVYFLHRIKSRNVLKLDCDKERTDNGLCIYSCYDNNGKEQKVTPGPEWQLVELSSACLLNTVTDTINNFCAGVAVPGEEPMLYICQERKEVFQVSEQWEPLPADDDRCGSRQKDVVELIRGDSSSSRSSQIEWSTDNVGQD